jgi:hypothetical protein
MSIERVVVTLSTLPKRVKYLDVIVRDLLKQTRPADVIYLCLPSVCKRTKEKYPKVSSFVLENCTILECEDLGPVTRYLPVLDVETDGNTALITIDDDDEYDCHLIESLVGGAEQLGSESCVSAGGRIVGKFPWICEMVRGKDLQPRDTVAVDTFLGTRGTLFMRKFFGPGDQFLQFWNSLPADIRWEDDTCVSGFLAQQNIGRFVVHVPVVSTVMTKRKIAAKKDSLFFQRSKISRAKAAIQYFRPWLQTPVRHFYKTISFKIMQWSLIIVLVMIIMISLLLKHKQKLR